jgi:hypothetical protein
MEMVYSILPGEFCGGLPSSDNPGDTKIEKIKKWVKGRGNMVFMGIMAVLIFIKIITNHQYDNHKIQTGSHIL